MTREQAERLIAEVAGLRRAVEVAVGIFMPPEQTPACTHPIEVRIDESGMGQAPWTTFQCTACGKRVTP